MIWFRCALVSVLVCAARADEPVVVLNVARAAEVTDNERGVALVLERDLQRRADVRHVRLTATAHGVRVEVVLAADAEVERFVRALSQNPPDLPTGALLEVLPASAANERNVLWHAFERGSDGLEAASRVVDLRAALERLPGVARVRTAGLPARQVEVAFAAEQLALYGWTRGDPLAALRAALAPRGEVSGDPADLETLGEIVLDVREGHAIRLRDVATVALGVRRDEVVTVDGRDAWALFVAGAASEDVGRAVQQARDVLAHEGPGRVSRVDALRLDPRHLVVHFGHPIDLERAASVVVERTREAFAPASVLIEVRRRASVVVWAGASTRAATWVRLGMDVRSALPEASVRLGGTGTDTATFVVSGDEPDAVRARAAALRVALAAHADVRWVDDALPGSAPQVALRMDSERCDAFGLDVAWVESRVQEHLRPTRVGALADGDPIVVVPSALADDVEGVGELRIPTPAGTSIALRELAQLEVVASPAVREREDGRAVERVRVLVARERRAAVLAWAAERALLAEGDDGTAVAVR